MRFTLSQLEAFYWIQQLGSFRAAALRLNLTQPAVSSRVHELEQALGQTLFDRTGKKVRLTGEGLILRKDVERILATTSRIRGRAAAQTSLRGIFRFGAPEGFAVSCLTGLVEWLEHVHPELELEIVIDTSDELMAMVGSGRVDLSLVTNPIAPTAAMQVEPLGRYEMSWIASPQFQLPHSIRPTDIASLNVLATAPGSPMYHMIQQWFLADGLAPARIHTCNTLAVISQLVEGGIGVSVLPCTHLQQKLQAGTLVKLQAQPKLAVATMAAVYLESEDGPAIRVIIEACRRVMAQKKYVELFSPPI